jgi:stearoyl-CoA desaturase (delta-9 desaturase)
MPPFSSVSSGEEVTSKTAALDTRVKSEDDVKDKSGNEAPVIIVWKNIFLFVVLHSSLFYSLYSLVFFWPWKTLLFSIMLGIGSGLGVTAGNHRLWSHKAYKAKLPLRIFLAIMQTVAGQNDIYEWSRDHRVHHKYSETHADPHNAKRGFFFSHMGWLCVRKHPLVLSKGKSVDLSDLLEDPVVRFQKKFYIPLAALFCFILPTLIPVYCWSEKWLVAYMMAGLARYCVSLHVTWLVNSAAHMWGNRPYDESIGARENMYVSFASLGEGFHNYHHTFPWDYSVSEFGYHLNFSTLFIDVMAKMGQAYDLKKPTQDLVDARKQRTGDGHDHEHDH